MTAKGYKEGDPYMAQRVYRRRVWFTEEDGALLAEEKSWEDLAGVVDFDSPEASAVRAQASAKLEQLIASLPRDEQETVSRRFLKGESPDQIAHDLQITMPRLLGFRSDALYRLKQDLRANSIRPEDFEPPDPETR